MKKQAQLGLFILIGFVGIAVSILTIKNISFEKGYRLKVKFNEVSGLVEKSWVRVSGVKIGK